MLIAKICFDIPSGLAIRILNGTFCSTSRTTLTQENYELRNKLGLYCSTIKPCPLVVTFFQHWEFGDVVRASEDLIIGVDPDAKVVSSKLAGWRACNPQLKNFCGCRIVGMVVPSSSSITLSSRKMALTGRPQKSVRSTAGAANSFQTMNSLQVKWRPSCLANRTGPITITYEWAGVGIRTVR